MSRAEWDADKQVQYFDKSNLSVISHASYPPFFQCNRDMTYTTGAR